MPMLPTFRKDSSARGSSADTTPLDRQGRPVAAGSVSATRHYRSRLLLGGLLCLAVGGLALVVDLPVAGWFAAQPLPRALVKLLDLSEIFGSAVGVAMLMAAVTALDPSLRRPWFHDLIRMSAACVSGGLLVDLGKLLVNRVRPHAVDWGRLSSALDTFGTAAAADPAVAMAVWTWRKPAAFMSFPSGHAAVAAGFAAALGWKYPAGRWVFFIFAVLAAVQRLSSSSHYPSDVAVGGGLALIAAALWLSKPAECGQSASGGPAMAVDNVPC
jgi:membrane-associated phospholipid phosphatase